MMCLGVDFFVFIMFDILSACWQFSAIFFFRYFSTTHSFSSLYWIPVTQMLDRFDTLIPPAQSFFFLLFKLTT